MQLSHFTRPSAAVMALVFTAETTFPSPAQAQGYQIDCAILLCLAGGFPPSQPCALARAEFIRRVTPWPVEPPLQIWRCPMGVSTTQQPGLPEVLDAMMEVEQPTFSPWHEPPALNYVHRAVLTLQEEEGIALPDAFLHRVQQADIDVSDPVFNFIRSIRVIDIAYSAWVHESENGDHNCIQGANRQRQGVYGPQGAFAWEAYRANDASYPPATWLPFRITMENGCPVGSFQGIGVEWQDWEGNHSYEVITY